MQDSRDEMMRRCIQDCETCHALCVRTLDHCLQQGGKFVAHDHVAVLLDCIQICDVSRDFMLRGSPRHRLTCSACAEISDICATSCSALKGDDQLERCQAECHRCGESCRQMANHHAAGPRAGVRGLKRSGALQLRRRRGITGWRFRWTRK